MNSSTPWVNDPDKNINKNEIFRIFVNYAPNETWKIIFTDMLNSKLPKNMSYNGEVLIYSRGSKKLTFNLLYNSQISETDIYNVMDELMTFIETCINKRIYDEDESQQLLYLYSKNRRPVKWSSIRRRPVKEKYISNYVRRITTSLGINDEDIIYKLYIQLLSLFNLEYIQSSDVIFNNDEIQTINGLMYDGTNGFYISNPRRKKRYTAKAKLKSPYIIDIAWEKYIKTIRKERFPTNKTGLKHTMRTITTINSDTTTNE